MFEELKIGWRYFLRTWPQVCLRTRWYGFFALGAILYWGVIFGFSLIFKSSTITWVLFFLGLGGAVLIYRFFKQQVFSILEANYLAVLVELATHEKVPVTKFQIRFSRKKVTQKFGNRQRIYDAYVRLHKSLNEILVASPFPLKMGAPFNDQSFFFRKTWQKIWRKIWFVDLFLNMKYMTALLISHCFIKKDEILWENLRESLILCAQNFKKIYKSSVYIYLLTILFSAAYFMVLLPPLLGLSMFLPSLKLYFLISAFIMTWAFKKILLDSFALATLVSEFRKIVEGQSPDPQWDKRLAGISKYFFEIKRRAIYWEHAQRPVYDD